jgi:hypothetical protein
MPLSRSLRTDTVANYEDNFCSFCKVETQTSVSFVFQHFRKKGLFFKVPIYFQQFTLNHCREHLSISIVFQQKKRYSFLKFPFVFSAVQFLTLCRPCLYKLILHQIEELPSILFVFQHSTFLKINPTCSPCRN